MQSRGGENSAEETHKYNKGYVATSMLHCIPARVTVLDGCARCNSICATLHCWCATSRRHCPAHMQLMLLAVQLVQALVRMLSPFAHVCVCSSFGRMPLRVALSLCGCGLQCACTSVHCDMVPGCLRCVFGSSDINEAAMCLRLHTKH